MNQSEISIRLLPTFVLGFLLASCSTPTESPPPPMALSPSASIATIQMPKGYRLEPVLTDDWTLDSLDAQIAEIRQRYVAQLAAFTSAAR